MNNTFAEDIWDEESLRRLRMNEYAPLVMWYLRKRSTAQPVESERVVPIVMYPEILWDIESSAKQKQLIQQAMSTSSALSALVYQQVALNTESYNGETYLHETEFVPRGNVYTHEWVRMRRQGIVVGRYFANREATIRTALHELGHYVGVTHVFTADSLSDTGCAERELFNGSFLDTMKDPTLTKELKSDLCDCFFGNGQHFADYDGHVARVSDTPLQIRLAGSPIDNWPYCTVSKKYRDTFSDTDQQANSSENVMTYVSSFAIKSWTDLTRFTSSQQETARAVLKSFQ